MPDDSSAGAYESTRSRLQRSRLLYRKSLCDTMESFASSRAAVYFCHLRVLEMCGIHLNRVHSEKCSQWVVTYQKILSPHEETAENFSPLRSCIHVSVSIYY